MRMKLRKNKFWVLKCKYLYIFDSEEEAIDQLAKLFISGECEEIEESDMHSIEKTEEGFMVRGMDWRKIFVIFAGKFDKYNEKRRK